MLRINLVISYNKRREFIPPSDLEFIDAHAEPEPRDDTPYNYFKSFVTVEMFAHIALESNKYVHQKKGETLTNYCPGT